MFSWATHLIEIILSNFYLRELSNLEIFYFINYVFPIMIITFIFSLAFNLKHFMFFILCGLLTALGFGFGYINYDYKIALCFIFPSIIIIVIIIAIICCSCKNLFDEIFDGGLFYSFNITSSSFITLITMSIILIPFLLIIYIF